MKAKRPVIFGAIHKLGHTNFMIFYPSPLVTGGHISETPTQCDITYFAILHLEIIKLRVGATSNSAK